MTGLLYQMMRARLPALAAACAPGAPALDQSDDDVDPFNWGYAAAFGRGAYGLGDGSDA